MRVGGEPISQARLARCRSGTRFSNCCAATNWISLLETGTFLGDTATFLSAHGYEVITIELDFKLAALGALALSWQPACTIDRRRQQRTPAGRRCGPEMPSADPSGRSLFRLGTGKAKSKRRFAQRSISSCNAVRPAAWLPSTMRAASAPRPIIRRSRNFSMRCRCAASATPASPTTPSCFRYPGARTSLRQVELTHERSGRRDVHVFDLGGTSAAGAWGATSSGGAK